MTLANKIPADRAIYLKLSNEKQHLMSEQFRSSVKGFEFLSGSIPGHKELPDIDLAIIDASTKSVILAEMKWFLPPAETREGREKTAELRKGTDQLRNLIAHSALVKMTLGVGSDYELHPVVVSKNWIGHWEAQDNEIPIVQMEHLIHEINATHDAARVGLWLKERKYLPVEGTDFEIIWRNRDIFGRHLRWYGLRLLQP